MPMHQTMMGFRHDTDAVRPEDRARPAATGAPPHPALQGRADRLPHHRDHRRRSRSAVQPLVERGMFARGIGLVTSSQQMLTGSSGGVPAGSGSGVREDRWAHLLRDSVPFHRARRGCDRLRRDEPESAQLRGAMLLRGMRVCPWSGSAGDVQAVFPGARAIPKRVRRSGSAGRGEQQRVPSHARVTRR